MEATTEHANRTPPRFRGHRGAAYRALLAGSIAGFAYAVILVGYLSVASHDIVDPTRAVYPLIWFATGVAGLAAVSTGPFRRPPNWAIATGVAYVLVLSWISGHLTIGSAGTGLSIVVGMPGWAPIVVLDLLATGVVVVPFQSFGYLVLGSLLALGLTVSRGSVLAGLSGVFACAGCVLPLVAAVTAAGSVPLLGSSASYPLSTLAFVLTTVLLSATILRGNGASECRRSPDGTRR